jgi:hypothetical protein
MVGEESRKSLTLGASNASYGQCNAILSGVKLYNRALTELEIKNLHKNDL